MGMYKPVLQPSSGEIPLPEQQPPQHPITTSSSWGDTLRLLFRTLGFRILSATDDEPPKRLVHRSFRAVLVKSAIHLIPSTLSVALIVLNWRGFFIGGGLQGAFDHIEDDVRMAALQVASKVQVSLRRVSGGGMGEKSFVDVWWRNRKCSSSRVWGR